MKKWMDCFEEYVIAVFICAMVLFETANAVLHVTGSEAVGLPQEFAVYFYVWIAFLSMSFCAKKGCDIAVTMISDHYSKSVKNILKMVCNLINIAVSVCLLVGAVGFLADTAAEGTLSKLAQIPMIYVNAAAVVGFGLCVVRNIQALNRIVKSTKA